MDLAMLSACIFLIVTCFSRMCGYEVAWTNLADLQVNICYMEDTRDFMGMGGPIVR